MDHIEALRRANEAAKRARASGNTPFGAVLVGPEGQILLEQGNAEKDLGDATAHAEMIAMTSATEALGGKYLQDCTLYVTVEPCPMCAAATAWAQLGRLVYGAADPRRGYTLFSPSLLHPKTQVCSGILEEDCSTLMIEFFKNKR